MIFDKTIDKYFKSHNKSFFFKCLYESVINFILFKVVDIIIHNPTIMIPEKIINNFFEGHHKSFFFKHFKRVDNFILLISRCDLESGYYHSRQNY